MSAPAFNLFNFSPESDLANAFTIYTFVLRGAFFIVFVLYALFAGLVVRQVYLMDQTIKTPLAPILKLTAWLHLLLAIFATVLVFVAL